MFIGPPKLVFIKTSEGTTQATLRPGGPKGQTILVAPAPTTEATTLATVATTTTASTVTVPTTTIADDSPDETPTPRILRRHAAERKYGKKKATATSTDNDESKDEDNVSETSSMF
jgi:hypothetical protein